MIHSPLGIRVLSVSVFIVVERLPLLRTLSLSPHFRFSYPTWMNSMSELRWLTTDAVAPARESQRIA